MWVDGASFEELSRYPLPCSYEELAAPAHAHGMELQLPPLCAWSCTCCLVQKWARMWPLDLGHRV